MHVRPCTRLISLVDHFHRLNVLESGFSLCHTFDWRLRSTASPERRRNEDGQNHKPAMMTVNNTAGPTVRRPIPIPAGNCISLRRERPIPEGLSTRFGCSSSQA